MPENSKIIEDIYFLYHYDFLCTFKSKIVSRMFLKYQEVS